MNKYPFSPEILDALPEKIAELFRNLELTLLEEICSRLNLGNKLNEVTVQDIRALRSHGIDFDDIEKVIKEVTGISDSKLTSMLNEVVEQNQIYYTELMAFAAITQPEHIISDSDINAIIEQTKQEMANITRSIGFLVDNGRTKLKPATAYQWALDNAAIQVQSGVISYNQAIKGAVKELADSGIKTVNYESGHIDQVDVAARRAVLTGISQLCDKYTEQSANFLNTPYFEVSAHSGARDKDGPKGWENHKKWQGKVYSERYNDIYPNIYTECGFGEVDGLEGANCRHRRFPWVEGVSRRTYTDEQLANIDPPPFEYEGRTYTAYEAAQKQRQIERTIRKLKREKAAYKKAGLEEDARNTNIRQRRLNEKYKEFSKAAGLKEKTERMKVSYVDDDTIGEAKALKADRDTLEESIRQ